MKENKSKNKKDSTSKVRVSGKSINKVNKKKSNKLEAVLTEEKVVENDVFIKDSDKQIDSNTSSMFSFFEVIIIAFIAAVVGIFFTAGFYSLKEETSRGTDKFTQFLDVYDELVDEYYTVVDEKGLLEAGIKGMVDFLGDSNSYYLDYESSSSLTEELEGEFVGIGVVVNISESGDINILELYKDGPGQKAGLMVGDIIKKVDDIDISGIEDLNKIKGKEGTKVNITVLRDGEEKTITLVREKVELQSVNYFVAENGNVGYIGIGVFAKNTPKQFERAMNILIKENVDSVIIDVRNNSGGYLDVAKEIASMFLAKGSVVYQLNTKGNVEKIISTEKNKYSLNVAVLVNNGSASASEVLAASLSENVNAPIIGTKTYGKGTVQKTKQLESGAMIKYTIQEWYTPKGNKVDGVGLIPTYDVELTKDYYDDPCVENDNQLKKAIEIIKK